MDKKSGKKARKESNKNANKTTEKPEKQNSKKPNNDISTKMEVLQKPVVEYSDDVLQISQPVENKFKKREIQSNWSRYEAPIDDYEDSATDFETLVQAPISVGGHFKFKSEKVVEYDIAIEYGDYFKLNIDKLAENLQTIPFYKRHELDEHMFNSSEIKSMNSKCSLVETDCANKIMNILSNTSIGSSKSKTSLKSVDLTKSMQEISVKNSKSQPDLQLGKENIKINLEDDIDELLELKSPVKLVDQIKNTPEVPSEPELKNITKPSPKNSRTNLENWLDDLLQ